MTQTFRISDPKSRFNIYLKRERIRYMGGFVGIGILAVFAVSGSVVLLVHQVHKRLHSEFMKKLESELSTVFPSRRKKKKAVSELDTISYSQAKNKSEASEECQAKKKVRFADDVKEPSSNNKEYRQRQILQHRQVMAMKYLAHRSHCQKLEHAMPANRQALYKGINEYKVLKEQSVYV